MNNGYGISGAALVAVIKAYFLPISAAVLLVIAVVLALIDRVAAGSLVAALFVVLALFHFLPQMESFKAFGIEAKWRARLREAEEILDKLRKSAMASAELGYFMLSWGSRMGSPRSKVRQSLADQIDSVLNELNVDRDKLAALKRDYLFFAGFDLFQTFDAVVDLNIRTNRLQRRPGIDLLQELPRTDFRELCHSRIPKADLPEQDAAILARFADRVADILESCRGVGRVTNEAAELIDSYGQTDRLTLYRHLFNRDPTL
jgi:hypothetical protein